MRVEKRKLNEYLDIAVREGEVSIGGCLLMTAYGAFDHYKKIRKDESKTIDYFIEFEFWLYLNDFYHPVKNIDDLIYNKDLLYFFLGE